VRFRSISLSEKTLSDFCKRRKITELALFGSVLRDDFDSSSDVDVLVTFAPDCGYSLFDLVEIQEELKSILGHEVDMVERAALQNPFRRHSILNSMEVVYAAPTA